MAQDSGSKGRVPTGAKSNVAAAEVALPHYDEPARFERPKKIHPRHLLPFVREGVEREFHSTTPRAMIVPGNQSAGDDLRLIVNTALTQPGLQQIAGNVGEPSVAINGDVVFFTGNWYAAVSFDGGKTFRFIDPTKTQKPTDGGRTFCCDQVVNYIPQIDTFVWLLQYGPDTGDNIQRIGFTKTAKVSADQSHWRFFDLTTAMAHSPGAFMDFPDIAVGANFLYVTTNLFMPDNSVGSVVFRIPLASIESGHVTTESFVSMAHQSFRVAQNCGTTAYFAAHEDTSTLGVFSWPENAPVPTSNRVGVARWIGGNGYMSRTPDGRRWLDRADPRLTGATKAGDELWFAWSVDQGSNHRNKPFVQIARIAAHNTTLIENVNVFDTDSATAYGALATSANNEVGISYMIGGAVYPSHVVGILTGSRRDVQTMAGTRGPRPDADNKFQWGDYLTIRPVPGGNLFAAAGYTLLGQVDGLNDAVPRFVLFGRTNAAGGSGTTGGTTGAGTGGTGTTGGDTGSAQPGGSPTGGTGGPITDVNTLPTVDAQVALRIKAAAGIITAPQAAPAALFLLQAPELVTAPGKERWPVKTGRDDDVALVGKNIIAGVNLGAGIIATTVEELITAPRPATMPNVSVDPPGFLRKRAQPVETTIWQVEGTLTVLKLEADGDYHLVIQGASGETMIAEVPTPTAAFIGNSPWFNNIKAVRQAIDDKLVSKLSPADFVPLGRTLVPRESVSPELQAVLARTSQPQSFLPQSFLLQDSDPEASAMPAFKTRIKPTPARITGVGFFDKVHGQTGVSQSNGIELHSILKIEWL
jgi:hypothetical protein